MERRYKKITLFNFAAALLMLAALGMVPGCNESGKSGEKPAQSVAVTKVMLDKKDIDLAVGAVETLNVTTTPANATNKNVTWRSDNEAVATVNASGKVTAIKEGTATITVTTEDGRQTANCTVTVLGYSIAYELNGGTNASGNPASYTVEMPVITIQPATKSGYTFIGWYDNADFSGEPVVEIQRNSTGKKTLWAKWLLETYTITYELNGGTNAFGNPASYTVEMPAVAIQPATKSGYTFIGWYDNADFNGVKITEIAAGSGGDKTLYAKFKEEKFVKYAVGAVSFRMMNVRAVTAGTVLHSSENDNHSHQVSLTAYRIGETEVTQELWQAVMGANPSRFQGAGEAPADGEEQTKRPVERVSWYECIAFCNELTKKVTELGAVECVYYLKENDATVYTKDHAQAGKEPVQKLEKKGFRLPTEAEWEWAAMSGKTDRWAGTDIERELGTYAWYDSNSGNKTHEVKKRKPNGYRVYDMSGNVWEWCWDWYGTLPDPLPADYTGAVSGALRVARGGSWFSNADFAAHAFRFSSSPGSRSLNIGLRLVLRL